MDLDWLHYYEAKEPLEKETCKEEGVGRRRKSGDEDEDPGLRRRMRGRGRGGGRGGGGGGIRSWRNNKLEGSTSVHIHSIDIIFFDRWRRRDGLSETP